jgi:hypothetical protein
MRSADPVGIAQATPVRTVLGFMMFLQSFGLFGHAYATAWAMA